MSGKPKVEEGLDCVNDGLNGTVDPECGVSDPALRSRHRPAAGLLRVDALDEERRGASRIFDVSAEGVRSCLIKEVHSYDRTTGASYDAGDLSPQVSRTQRASALRSHQRQLGGRLHRLGQSSARIGLAAEEHDGQRNRSTTPTSSTASLNALACSSGSGVASAARR